MSNVNKLALAFSIGIMCAIGGLMVIFDPLTILLALMIGLATMALGGLLYGLGGVVFPQNKG